VETARIKVESLIHEDVHVELLELLELYCEMLLARFGLLDQSTQEPDVGVKESVCSIIYAAPRTELKELHILRDILMHKYGREFSVAVMENRDNCVSERVMRKLDVSTPSADLVDGYLHEIAKGYSINWSPPRTEGTVKQQIGNKDSHPDTEQGSILIDQAKVNDTDAAIDPPDQLPPEDDTKTTKDLTKPPPYAPTKAFSPGSDIPQDDFDSLAKRFAALKKP